MRRIALAIVACWRSRIVPIVTSAAPRSAASRGSDVRSWTRRSSDELVRLTGCEARRSATTPPRSETSSRPGRSERSGSGSAYDDRPGRLRQELHAARGRYQHRGLGRERRGRGLDGDSTSRRATVGTTACATSSPTTQVNYLIDQFDNNMYPIESNAFSVAPSPATARTRSSPKLLGLPEDYYRGPGDRIVVLIDNVRDENFYDTDNASGLTVHRGLLHLDVRRLPQPAGHDDRRVRLAPPDGPRTRRTSRRSDLCHERERATRSCTRASFAHEYQHLLENYVDVDETSWVNEGLSDYAQTITGYVDPSIPITQIG